MKSANYKGVHVPTLAALLGLLSCTSEYGAMTPPSVVSSASDYKTLQVALTADPPDASPDGLQFEIAGNAEALNSPLSLAERTRQLHPALEAAIANAPVDSPLGKALLSMQRGGPKPADLKMVQEQPRTLPCGTVQQAESVDTAVAFAARREAEAKLLATRGSAELAARALAHATVKSKQKPMVVLPEE